MSDETMINTKLERLQQLEAANKALHVQWRKNKKSKKSAKRAEKTARVTAETNARPRTMPSVRASVDTKLISKPEAFSVKDQWPRWLLTMKAYLGAVSGGLAENVEHGLDTLRSYFFRKLCLITPWQGLCDWKARQP